MVDWTGGYVSDVEYTAGFYVEQAPLHMGLVALLNGVAPPPTEGAFTYCELGCGRGFTLNVLAAANPAARFVGVDFNPAHIGMARRQAAEAGLTNVTYFEKSFEELLSERLLPEACDYITLHGVYSWVSDVNRQAIIEILRRHLGSGGFAYVSYNAQPGWATGGPLQRLLMEVSGSVAERSDRAVVRAVKFLEEMRRVGAVAVATSPLIEQLTRLVDLGNHRYLAHEYLNRNWSALYHMDVCRQLADAKLTYACSCHILENFTDLQLTGEQRELLETLPGAELRNLARDFITGAKFRRDLFVRGAQAVGSFDRERLLRAMPIALMAPRAEIDHVVRVPTGEATMNVEIYSPAFDAVAERTRPVGELRDAIVASGRNAPTAVELAGMMIGSAQCAPAVSHVSPATAEVCRRFNRLVASEARNEPTNRALALASPVLGRGVVADMADLMMYDALQRGLSTVEELSHHIWEPIKERGESMLKDGKPVSTEAENLEIIATRVGNTLEKRVATWTRLGVM